MNNFTNIFILDNNSTYKPLLAFYEELKDDKNVKIIFYNKNNGPRFFHLNCIFEILYTTPHLYTDPDIDFDYLPNEFMKTLLSVSTKYDAFKVGCALEIPNTNEINDELNIKINNKIYSITEWEAQFWKNEIEENIYIAEIDTTLHLFNPNY